MSCPTPEESPSKMELPSHRSSPSIEKISREASSSTDSETRQTILQTGASDEYWAAAHFEENSGKRNICGYTSGAFKPLELYYHSTFKEILALNHGIESYTNIYKVALKYNFLEIVYIFLDVTMPIHFY